jgi:CDP-glycerol glycerophosphotransferase
MIFSSASLINLVKSSKVLYRIYYYVGSVFIRLLKLFLIPDEKLIVFNSFGGRKFDDSPRSIYEAIIKDSRFDNYKLVWAFCSPNDFTIQRGEKVKVDSLIYYMKVLKARIWITNTTMTRALNFTGINTFSLNTWHGSAIKKIGYDINDYGSVFSSKGNSSNDIYLAQSQYDIRVFSNAFHVDPFRIKVIGLPRNDELVEDNINRNLCIRKKLKIPIEKRIILYAPTFRDYLKDGADCVFKFPIDFNMWKRELGDEYIILLRVHHAVIKILNLNENDYLRNVSSYPNLNDLMLVSDLLISDYSSIMFDFSILGKPIFCYTYDYDRYEKERGMYFDIRKELPSESDEDSLIKLIKEGDYSEFSEKTVRFREKYVTEYGSASQKAVDIIYDAIN